MGGCAAINCSNHSRNKFRMFRFPTDVVRRRKWAINCRRDGWVPGPRAELCSVHFEESQYEQHRADKVKKLKPNAIPTLFDFHSPPASKHIKEKSLHKPESVLDCTPVNHVCRGEARERPRLKNTALPSLYLPVSSANTAENIEGKEKVAKKKQGKSVNNECWKKQNPNMKKNIRADKRDGANVLLLLSSVGPLADYSRSLLKKNTDNRIEPALSSKIIENQQNSEITKNTSKVSDHVTSSMQEFNEECLEVKSDVAQENVLSIFRDKADSEVNTNSEDILFLENETEDSKEILKEKLRKLTVCYKNSQRKLKEYERLCKLYVKEVTALREVINNLKQINSTADNNYFEAKS